MTCAKWNMAIGDPQTVEQFVCQTVNERLGSVMTKTNSGWEAPHGQSFLNFVNCYPRGMIFRSLLSLHPTEKHHYLGRNHPFVEQLCQQLLANTIERRDGKAARASVIRSASVDRKTVILLFRVRNVIGNSRTNHRIVAEEMILWGYSGSASRRRFS